MARSGIILFSIFVSFFASICSNTFAVVPDDTLPVNNLRYEENVGQWGDYILFKADIQGGRVFLENNALTYVLYDLDEIEEGHKHEIENSGSIPSHSGEKINCHAYRMKFSGANPDPVIQPAEKLETYFNYFIGNDPSKWADSVGLFQNVTYLDLYKNINLKILGSGKNVKYEFMLYPGADPDEIEIIYEFTDGLSISGNNLLVKTSVYTVTEYKPYAYQEINGIVKPVNCNYQLTGNKVKFSFPDGYDERYSLIIDPVIVASTYSGSLATTYGHCATYDASGYIYTGGRCFDQGYPVTMGAFQTTFAGNVDIAVAKLAVDGSSMIYATYIGGTSDEYAQSLIANSNGELYIYGSCGSFDYPVTSGCYDNSQNGMYDIILTKLNSSGSALIGSTYVGGNMDDGSNAVYYNYGDTYRGEIMLDANEEPIIASFSSSSNFPATAGAFDNSYNGGQDGVVFKMNSNLTTMQWATFLGGTGDDAAYGVQVNSVGMVYVTGGTSGGFPTTPVVLHPTYQGGTYDGFISILSSNGVNLIASTYYGTSSFDELFFIDLDDEDNVYVYGLSEGTITPTPGVYTTAGSNGRLVTKFDATLNAVMFTTSFGSGPLTSSGQFSPTAFLVDVCQNIYMAGWGITDGYEVSSNAVQPTTDGQDFYLIVLKKDALSLLYATFYGDPMAWEHVDGGTSRFDKQGIVYEAVCAGGSDFPTNPGSVSTVNNTSWDIAVFKIDFQLGQVLAEAIAAPNDTGCVPFTVNFTNGSNGLTYFWDFGDGDTSILAAPSHTFNTPGTYNVMLIASDSMKCNISDTTYLTILVTPSPDIDLGNDTTTCPGDSIILDAGIPGLVYLWSTGETTQTITVSDSGIYFVEVHSSECVSYDTIQVSVPVLNPLASDATVCENTQLMLDAGNPGSLYLWSTGETTQTILVLSGGTYWVDIIIGDCSVRDTVIVTMVEQPHVNLGNDTTLCQTVNMQLDAGNTGMQYLWSTGESTQTINIDTAGTFWVEVANDYCSDSDTIKISAVYPPELGADATMCEQNQFVLDAGPSHGDYLWSTGETSQSIIVMTPGLYWVQVSEGICSIADTLVIEKGGSISLYFPNTFTPDADELNDVFKGYGEEITYFDLMIFTRWGQQIFRTQDPETGWDGTFEGVKVQQDIYVWIADYKTSCTGWNVQHKIGHVFVLR